MGVRYRVPRLWAVLVAAGGCVAEPSVPGFATRDSAGVTIAESSVPAWDASHAWRVEADDPVLIGTAGGAEVYQLSTVAGARRLSDGTIVVANAGGSQVRVYDGSGVHVMDLGKRGEGPGEFQDVTFLGVAGEDTLVVYDRVLRRYSWFTLPDGFAGSTNAPPPVNETYGEVEILGLRGDGTALGLAHPFVWTQDFVDGRNRFPTTVWRLPLDGTLPDSIGVAPGLEKIYRHTERGLSQQVLPFGRTVDVATHGSRAWVGATEVPEIRVYGPSWQLERIVRFPSPPRPVTESDMEDWVERTLSEYDASPEQVATWRRDLHEGGYAAEHPRFRSVTVDRVGNLWVEEWVDHQTQGAFRVFDPEGRMLGTVDFPLGLARAAYAIGEPWLEIGDSYLLGVWRDDLGVEQVRMYRLLKP